MSGEGKNSGENAEYFALKAIEYCKNTVDNFGPRFSCSEAETKAAESLKKTLDQYCDITYLDDFKAYPNLYPRGFILMGSIMAILGFPFIFFKSPYSLISTFFVLFGLFIVWVSFFLMKEWFAFFFKRGTSHNATGRIFPRGKNGEKKDAKKRVIICGHIDSAYQMKLTRYGDKIIYYAMPGLIFIIGELLMGIIKTLAFSFGSPRIYFSDPSGIIAVSMYDIVFMIFSLVGLPGLIFLIWGLVSGDVVPGANDNLSGIGIALAIGEYFTKKEHRLKEVELWIGGFGSEECGERGAYAFVKNYGKMGLLDDAIAVIPDSIGAGDRLTIISKEKVHYATHDMKVCKDLLNAYNQFVKEEGAKPDMPPEELRKYDLLPCKIQELPFAASDAGRFSLAGYSAASLIAFEGQLSKPKYWHNELDAPENLEIPAMKTTFGILKCFIENLDKKLSQENSG